ncbi:MAG: type IX secretion system sortase PorU [bacterium]
MFPLIFICVFSNVNIANIGDGSLVIEFDGRKINVQDLKFPGATSFAKPGEPDLPSLNLFVGVPQSGGVEVRVVEKQSESFSGIEIRPATPLVVYELPLQKESAEQVDVYRQNRFFPQDVIEVSQPGYMRDIRIVNIKLHPAQYNPVKKELIVFRKLKIMVIFKGKPEQGLIVDNSFEEIYKRLILNYEQCKYWRRSARQQSIKNPFSTGVWYKIEIDEEGIYKIDLEVLRSAGIDPKQFDPKTMKIYTAAFDLLPKNVQTSYADSLVEIPVYVNGEDDHSFDKQDYLVFYAYPASYYILDSTIRWFENGYTAKNVYWFTFGGNYGKRMLKINAAWNNSSPDTIVSEILHIEKDVGNPTRSGINWFWQDISLGNAESTSINLPVVHYSAHGQAHVTVSVFNAMTPSSQPFWLRFGFNGDDFLDDTLTMPQSMALPAVRLEGNGILNGDSSVFEFKIKRPAGTTAELTMYLNCLDLEYQRRTDLTKPFHAYFKNANAYTIRCKNVNSKLFVLDISDLRKPTMFDNFTTDGKDIIFSSQCDSHQLLYLTQLNSAINVKLIPAHPGRLRTADNGCEYLVITHRNFYNSIMPLVNYRHQTYSTKVVTVDAIFDDFSYGKYDPLAIKHFLYHTYNHWNTVPKYVLLVGDATYDYKNNLGKENPPNYIPMYEAGTTLSGNPGIPPNYIYEGEYVNFFGTEAMVMGRITVRNNMEVRDFIDKLIAYEQSDIDGIWNKRIILSADDEYATNWEGVEHAVACEAVSAVVPDSLYDRAKVYELSYLPFPPHEAGTTKPLATEDFIKELNNGALIGCFFGHGNTHQLAHEKLFYGTYMPLINNGKRFFFFYFASCTVGRFDDSDYECIAEEFVRIKQGAIGTMGAHAASNTGMNQSIGIQLFRSFTDPGTDLTMGECYYIAKHSGGGIATYLMLGDPATKLRRVKNNFQIQPIPDSVRPLEKLRVVSDRKPYYLNAYLKDTTHIKWIDATTANKISGHIRRTVRYGSGPGDTTVFDYHIEGKEIYRGYWTGDTAKFIVPQISTTNLPIFKLSGYKEQTSAYADSIKIYGTAAPSVDQNGPDIDLYDGARPLKDGDWVDSKFTLTGVVADESGINLLNSKEDARGFFLYLGRDNVINRIDLRSSFIYNQNSYSEGEFKTDITLENPQESITVYVSDNIFNQTIKKVILNTNIYERISIENILVYPNPVKNYNGIWLTYNLSQSAKVTIKIYTIAGRLVRIMPEIPCHPGYNQKFWDGRDEYGDNLSNGVYLVYILAEGNSGTDKKIEKFIVAR